MKILVLKDEGYCKYCDAYLEMWVATVMQDDGTTMQYSGDNHMNLHPEFKSELKHDYPGVGPENIWRLILEDLHGPISYKEVANDSM